MTALPAAGYFSDPARTNAEAKTAQDDTLAFVRQMPGGDAEAELTIAAGIVTPTGEAHTIDTESDASTDDLTNIATTNLPDGALLTIRCANGARVPTVKHNAGGSGAIVLRGGADVALSSTMKFMRLRRVGSNWIEVADHALAAASDTAAGTVELATNAEAQAGSDTGRAVTPAGLAAAAHYQGKQAVPIAAGALVPRATNGPATGSVETASNKVMLASLDFDAATIEYAQFALRMPKSWNEGTVTASFIWSHAATTTNFKVSWGLQAVALSDDDAADGTAFGTAQYSNDTGGTTDDVYISPETAAITIAGSPAAEDWVVFQVLRKADDGANDTLAVDARLLGVTLYLTTDSKNDA